MKKIISKVFIVREGKKKCNNKVVTGPKPKVLPAPQPSNLRKS